jgi:hypothetical protein
VNLWLSPSWCGLKKVQHASKLKAEATRISIVAKFMQTERKEGERRAFWLWSKAVLKEQLKDQAVVRKWMAQRCCAASSIWSLLKLKVVRQKAQSADGGQRVN